MFWYPELHLPLVVLFCFPHEKCGCWQISYGPLQNENTSCQVEKWQFAYSSDVWRKQRSQVVLSLVSPTLMRRTRRRRFELLNQGNHHCLNILSHCSWSKPSSWCGGGAEVVCPCPTTAGWPLSHAGGGGSRQVDILLAPSYRYTAVKRHCTDWYELWALTDHEIYYIRFELGPRQTSNVLFSETEKGFGVGPTPTEKANVQGFYPLFHDSDLAPLFHPLWCLEMSGKRSNHASNGSNDLIFGYIPKIKI